MGSHYVVGSDVSMLFGFLRAGEAVAPEKNFDVSQHLTYADIAVDDLADPKQLQLNIKQSKTDPFSLGVKVWIGRTGGDLSLSSGSNSLLYGFARSRRVSVISLSEWQSSNEAEAGYQDAGSSAESGHRL